MLRALREFIVRLLLKESPKGVMTTLPNKDLVDMNVQMLAEKLMRNGVDPNSLKNANQVENAIKMIENRSNVQQGIKSTKTAEVFDLEGKKIDPKKGIMGGKQIDDDLPPPGSRGGKDDIAAPVQSAEETIKNMIEAENKKNIGKMRNRKMVKDAIDNVSPGFVRGDRKYNAQLVAEDLADKKFGKEFYDLDQKQQMDLYDEALDGLSVDLEDFAQGGRAGFVVGGITGLTDLAMRLARGFMKVTGRKPNDEEIMKIIREAAERDFAKVSDDVALKGVSETRATARRMDSIDKNKLKKEIDEYNIPVRTQEQFDFAQGGRIGYKIGGIDKARRAFLKAAAGVTGGIAALKTGLLNIGKGADTVKNLPPIKTPVTKLEGTTTQMPEWFPSFINKFRDEGKATNVFKREKVKVSKAEYDKAIAEGKGENYYRDDARTPEYKANNPDHMDFFKLEETDERIYTTYTNDKVPGVRVDDMDGNVDVMFENEYSQPVSLNYTAPGKRGPETGRADVFVQGEAKMEPKPKGEFVANDVEVYATDPDGGSEAVDVIANTVDDMLEGTTRQMEEYATGKKTKMSSGEFRVGQAEARAEQAAEEAAEAADEFASGGLAGMLGE